MLIILDWFRDVANTLMQPSAEIYFYSINTEHFFLQFLFIFLIFLFDCLNILISLKFIVLGSSFFFILFMFIIFVYTI